jgi:thiol-disulfide isomerase/thioredoxin
MLSIIRFSWIVVAVAAVSVLHAAALNAPAPGFKLANSAGHPRSLSEYKGNIVFVNFWASWCGPCQQELPELNKLAAHYAGRGVRVLVINVEKTRTPGKALLARLGLTRPNFEVLWDSRSKAVSAYDIPSMPTSFVLDSRGVIRFIHNGYHPENTEAWRSEINQLLAMARPAARK